MIRTKLAQIIDNLATQKAYYLIKQAEYDKFYSGPSQYDGQDADRKKLLEAQESTNAIADLLDYLPFDTAYRLSDRLRRFSEAQTSPFTTGDAVKDLIRSEVQRAHRKKQWKRFRARMKDALDLSNYIDLDSIPPEAVVLGAGVASGLGAIGLWRLLKKLR